MPRKGRSKSTGTASVDPKLVRQMAEAPAGSSVQAVFTLKTPAGESYRSAASTRDAVKKLIEEASATTSAQPERVTVFANVQSFAVSAPSALVRSLAHHSDIASATANVQDEDLLIRPLKGKAKTKKAR